MENRSKRVAMVVAVAAAALCAVTLWNVGSGAPLAVTLSPTTAGEPERPATDPIHGEFSADADSAEVVDEETSTTAGEGEGEGERQILDSPDDAHGSPAAIADFIDDLRDDAVPHNAGKAMRRLVRLGKLARPWLEGAITADDDQQRHLAAALLRPLQEDEPSAGLLRVTVEGLSRRYNRIYELRRTSECFGFLLRHPELAHRPMLDALYNGDSQQRFLCAFLLAKTGSRSHFWTIAETLVPHLQDNRIGGDGMMAAHGLYCLGPSVLSVVEWARGAADLQARRFLDLIELDLIRPPRSRQELRARVKGRGLRHVTQIYHDPVIEYNALRSRLPTW